MASPYTLPDLDYFDGEFAVPPLFDPSASLLSRSSSTLRQLGGVSNAESSREGSPNHKVEQQSTLLATQRSAPQVLFNKSIPASPTTTTASVGSGDGDANLDAGADEYEVPDREESCEQATESPLLVVRAEHLDRQSPQTNFSGNDPAESGPKAGTTPGPPLHPDAGEGRHLIFGASQTPTFHPKSLLPANNYAASSAAYCRFEQRDSFSSRYMYAPQPSPQSQIPPYRHTTPIPSISAWLPRSVVESPQSHSPPPLETPQRSPERLAVPEISSERDSSLSSNRLSIRATSRSRANSNGTGSAACASGEICAQCEEIKPDTSFCNICKHVFCDQCWDMQLTHKKQAQNKMASAHVKTDHDVAKKIRNVLAPAISENALEKQHEQDIDTTWFGVVREEHPLPLIRDYGRYGTLIARLKDMRLDLPPSSIALSDHNDTLYPSLVSFVGQTGAGKSTLIKLLIDLRLQSGDPKFPAPVPGAPGKHIATSEDVHLYLDPDSSLSRHSQAPLLFADCEGLEAGERDPVAARLKKKLADATSTGSHRKAQLKHTSERELVWADEPKLRTREYAVAHLYPRLLYTFSDTIVYVLRNPRTIEDVLVRLLDWAQAALEKSSNQPVLPHAIIVFNFSEENIAEELWRVDYSTTDLLQSLSRTVFHNPKFKTYADFWRQRDRQIETVEQLILSYYTSLRVVRMPTGSDPRLVQEQMSKLSTEIEKACRLSRDRKLELRMLLDADEIQPYLQFAFDHFAKNLNDPFDFVQASFANSPIPTDFGGNILKLAIQVTDSWQNLATGPPIFQELSYIVASCIMLDVARHRYQGKPSEIFPMYLGHIENALENFCDRHWPCEFVGPKGRCVNVRSGHGAKGHQLKSGTLLAAGDYQSTFSFAGYLPKFRDDVYERLDALSSRVQRLRYKEDITEDRAAAEVHRDEVLPTFFTHAFRGDVQAYISHSVCFVCLFEPPEHALPCGHIICTPCLKTFGRSYVDRPFEILGCPMESKEHRFAAAWQVNLKPENCGVRVLTLDGGGVRGVVELEILKQLEKELGGHLNIRSFFDLIVGTSTGGIISLGLAARGWTVEQCSKQFDTLCRKAFTARKGTNMPFIGSFVEIYCHSRYETQPLQEALTATFKENQYLFGGEREVNERMDVKVAVTATSTSLSAVVLANYNRLCTEKLSYHFQRPEKLQSELKTWEAARATSAAPTYFREFAHEGSKQVFVDGGIYHNNPIYVADQERKLIWPTHQDSEPDIVVSLGTAYTPENKKKQKRYIPFPASSRGLLAYGKNMYRLLNDHLLMSLESENVWREYLRIKQLSRKDRERYVRINPEMAEVPKLDDVESMGLLKEATRLYLDANPAIPALAKRLVATSFYFDPSGPVEEISNVEAYEVSGYVKCRFMSGSPEITELGRFLNRHAVAGHDPLFLITEDENNIEQPQEVLIDKQTRKRMVEECCFRLPNTVRIRRHNQHTKTEISLCLTRGTSHPISGFPRKLHSGDAGIMPANRHVFMSTNSVRWAARTPSAQLQRRRDWTPPTSPPDPSVIERYSEVNHLLFNGPTVQDLMNGELQELDDPAGSPAAELQSQGSRHDPQYVAIDDWIPPPTITQGLRLRKNDLVGIISKREDGWWWGYVESDRLRQGLIPPSWLVGPKDDPTDVVRSELDATFTARVRGRFQPPAELP